MPSCARPRDERMTFDKATTPAPWTLPARASLFTRHYPSQHGTHATASLKRLSPSLTLAAELAKSGDRPCSLLWNALLRPATGPVNGFDQAHWAEWWEPFFPAIQLDGPLNVSDGSHGLGRSYGGRHRLWGALRFFLPHLLLRHPLLADLANRALKGLASRPQARSSPSTWMERTFRSLVGSTPLDRPGFTFINRFDAHEPYFDDPGDARSLGSRWDAVKLPQERGE